MGIKKEGIAQISAISLEGQGVEGLTLEYSLHGDQWTEAQPGDLQNHPFARYLRVINKGDSPVSCSIQKLGMTVANQSYPAKVVAHNMGSLYGGTSWDNILDGNFNTYAWTSKSQAVGDFFTVDTDRQQPIHDVTIYTTDGGDCIKGAEMFLSSSPNGPWQSIGTVSGQDTVVPPHRVYAFDGAGAEGFDELQNATMDITASLPVSNFVTNPLALTAKQTVTKGNTTETTPTPTPTPAPTAEPTPAPTPAPTTEPTPAPTATPEVPQQPQQDKQEQYWMSVLASIQAAAKGAKLESDGSQASYVPGYIITAIKDKGITLLLTHNNTQMTLTAASLAKANGSLNYTIQDLSALLVKTGGSGSVVVKNTHGGEPIEEKEPQSKPSIPEDTSAAQNNKEPEKNPTMPSVESKPESTPQQQNNTSFVVLGIAVGASAIGIIALAAKEIIRRRNNEQDQ